MRYMRKTTLVIIGIAAGIAMVFLAGLGTSTQTVSADAGPHVQTGTNATPDKCAGCHRIHTGKNKELLKEAGSVEDFCYSCHGTGGPGSDLAAQNGSFYGTGTDGPPYGPPNAASETVGLRAGGFDEARIDTTDPSTKANPSIGVLTATETVVSQHAIDGTIAGTMWGNGAINPVADAGPSKTLDCGSCHDPHGNGNYRILRTVPKGSGGAGYAIPDTYPKTAADYATDDYFDMTFTGNLATDNILKDTSAWCSQCHTRYLATDGAALPADGAFVDSGDAIFTFRHESSGYSPGPVNEETACITCHASHGSNATMPGADSSTVPWPDGSTVNPANDLERASMLKMDNRGICLKCHNE